MFAYFALLLSLLPLHAQTLREGEIYGRSGWILENSRLRVSVVRAGGHIAEVRLISNSSSNSINPMFVPSGRGYIGHMVCFPHYGPASAEERRLGLRGHGEAAAVEWTLTRPTQTNANGIVFFYGAELPKTHYRIERAVSLASNSSAVQIEEWVENLAMYDRPFNHVQHATFGAPFLEPGRTVLDLSGGRGRTDARRTAGNQWLANRDIEWPQAPTSSGGAIDLREFRAVPGGQVYTAILFDPARELSWFTLCHREAGLLVGYLFPTADHPWIADWQNRPNADNPNGVARGIEFGTSPFDEGLRQSVERAKLFDVPTYRWIAAGERRKTTFTIFLAEIPPAFDGVREVRSETGTIVITERGNGRELRVPGPER